jgi:hypothetical protein
VAREQVESKNPRFLSKTLRKLQKRKADHGLKIGLDHSTNQKFGHAQLRRHTSVFRKSKN